MPDCECGVWRAPGFEACERCLFLDGRGTGEAAVVGALRQLGACTLVALADAAGMSQSAVRHVLQALKASGRVIRLETGEEHHANEPLFVLSDRRLVKPREPTTRFELAGARGAAIRGQQAA